MIRSKPIARPSPLRIFQESPDDPEPERRTPVTKRTGAGNPSFRTFRHRQRTTDRSRSFGVRARRDSPAERQPKSNREPPASTRARPPRARHLADDDPALNGRQPYPADGPPSAPLRCVVPMLAPRMSVELHPVKTLRSVSPGRPCGAKQARLRAFPWSWPTFPAGRQQARLKQAGHSARSRLRPARIQE